jgi:aspartyl-tRNA(Asn)/glutamyl-tRNA(Gln) amidotransferase subunit C
MTFKQEDVTKIAHLARLDIDDKEAANYTKELSNILDLVEQINQAKTADITPMSHPLENMIQPLREDLVSEKVDRDKYQEIAPKHEAGLYLVPQVIGEE